MVLKDLEAPTALQWLFYEHMVSVAQEGAAHLQSQDADRKAEAGVKLMRDSKYLQQTGETAGSLVLLRSRNPCHC